MGRDFDLARNMGGARPSCENDRVPVHSTRPSGSSSLTSRVRSSRGESSTDDPVYEKERTLTKTPDELTGPARQQSDLGKNTIRSQWLITPRRRRDGDCGYHRPNRMADFSMVVT
jgi:hypothetical protein